MSLWLLVGIFAAGALLSLAAMYFLARTLEKKEPYSAFLRLRGRNKVRF